MIDIRPVGNVLGWLVAFLGALMLPCVAIDWIDGDPNAREFALAAGLTFAVGGAIALACARAVPGRLDLRQGFLLTTGAWVLFPAVCAVPLMLGDPHLTFTDAYFEMTSAMTTTGGTVIVGLDHVARGVLLWRGLISWVGGMGVILLAMIVLPLLDIGGMQVLRNADFATIDKALPHAKAIARSIGVVYFTLTFACAIGYALAGMSGFDAIIYAMSSLATGGMGNYDSNFAPFSPAAQWIAAAFMLIGSLSFIRYVQLMHGDPRPLLRDSQIRTFLAIYLALAAGVVLARGLHGDAVDAAAVREAAFSMASIISTTGFTSTDYGLWGPLAETLFFCAMMICGCSGSTSGGPKVFRYQILAGAVSGEMRRLHQPSLVLVPHFQGVRLSGGIFDSVIAFFMMFFLTLGVGATALTFLGLDPISAISGAAANLSNVGPALGPVIGPVGNYASLNDPAKWVCAVLMLVGRLEILVVYVLLAPSFWRW